MIVSLPLSLGQLADSLKKRPYLEEKISLLESLPGLKSCAKPLIEWIETPKEKYLLYAVIAAGQAEQVFPKKALCFLSKEKMKNLFNQLQEVEEFYHSEGGIIAYQARLMAQLTEKREEQVHFTAPPFCELKGEEKEKATAAAIEHYPFFAEVYPIGGAGDRLALKAPDSQEPLPAAMLQFCGKTLLERLIEDVEAKENLYWKTTGKKIVTPLALMTSQEKNNHSHMQTLLEENNYFGRSKELFFLFSQPLVPVFSSEGKWLLKEPFALHRKPGGHGAIWKLMRERGVFAWLQSLGRRYLLVRQINNPLAGIDDTLLQFIGKGVLGEYEWGFCCCDRYVGASEGMNVLAIQDSFATITNVEYTEFAKKGITDVPKEKASSFSIFPANTNILFAKLDVLEKEAARCPFPGETLNLKTTFSCWERGEVLGGRLESTMQNIADSFQEPWQEGEALKRTFCTYHPRKKTIAPVKREFIPGKALTDTPWEALYDLMKQREELLQMCKVSFPFLPPLEEFIEKGPLWLFDYHPALGPLFSDIAKKLQGGKLYEGSFLRIDLANLFWKDVEVEGAFVIKGDLSSYCHLENVQVKGERLHPSSLTPSGCSSEKRVKITLGPNASFTAKNTVLPAGFSLFVEEGKQVVYK